MLETATPANAPYPGLPASDLTAGTTSGGGAFGSPAFDVPALSDGPKAVEVPILPTTGSTGNAVVGGGEYGVRVAGVAEDQGEGRLVYEPAHPDANADGYVRYPDVDTTQELVNLLDAKRIYEANATVFQTAKSMLRAALDI